MAITIRRNLGKKVAPLIKPKIFTSEIPKWDPCPVHDYSQTGLNADYWENSSPEAIKMHEDIHKNVEPKINPPVISLDQIKFSSNEDLAIANYFPDLFFIDYPDIPLAVSSNTIPISLIVPRANIQSVPLRLKTSIFQENVLPTLPEISNNLHKVFFAGFVRGKTYRGNEWENAFEKVTSKRRRKKQIKSEFNGVTKPGTDERHEVNVRPRPEAQLLPNFFDLIKPLLYPPPEQIYKENADNFLPPGLAPYTFQFEGIKKLVDNRFFLLADEMGTGKTVMATLAMRILFSQGKIKSALILCPVSVLRVWEEHIYRWSRNELAYVKVRGVKIKRDMVWEMPFHVYITSYDTYRSDVLKDNQIIGKNNFDLIILDESHLIKNKTSKRHKAVLKSDHKYIWSLTGTPLENSVEDVKSIYSVMKSNLISEEIKIPEKIKELIRPYMLRRLKQDVLKDLPPKTRQLIWLEMSQTQRRQYDNILSHGVAELSELHAKKLNVRIHIFALLNKLKQVSNFPRNSISSPKIDAAIDIVEEVRASGNKVLIFSQYINEGIDKIEKNLAGYGVRKYTGSMTSSQRDLVIDEFKKDPAVHVLIISTRAGSLGLNLTEANYVIHFDHWWNPAIMSQAEDRVHRVGQELRVTIYELWMEVPIEERIYKKLIQKQMLAKRVIDENATKGLTEKDLFTTDEWLHDIFQIGPEEYKSAPSIEKEPDLISKIDLDDIISINQNLIKLSPDDFEILAVELFKSLGYEHTKHVGRSHDGGIDVIAERFSKSKRETVIIQCKRYQNNVGVGAARELIGSLESISNCDKAYLVTTSDFTRECKRYAAQLGDRLELINGNLLARYIHAFNLYGKFPGSVKNIV